jgi:hypothetical protein
MNAQDICPFSGKEAQAHIISKDTNRDNFSRKNKGLKNASVKQTNYVIFSDNLVHNSI